MIERWLHAHRLSRAVFIAVTAGGLLLWALWNRPPPMTDRSMQTGEVVSAVAGGVTVIALADGKRVRALNLQPLPKAGDRIPMIVETYQDGSVYAVVDQESWRMESLR
jgi:hypothetical protein